jgi:hypothetical protein
VTGLGCIFVSVVSQPVCVTTNETLFEMCTFVPNTWMQIFELPFLLCVRTELSSVFAMRNHHFEGLSSKQMIRTVILFAGDLEQMLIETAY